MNGLDDVAALIDNFDPVSEVQVTFEHLRTGEVSRVQECALSDRIDVGKVNALFVLRRHIVVQIEKEFRHAGHLNATAAQRFRVPAAIRLLRASKADIAALAGFL